ncbi:hypothetical protein AKJ57_03705 [candidate division MSBL1 archaeon SCGC-AAA259A05]|uniref:Uncharacterized protein n=1 Tax=candidate division MSBL1 archaeon SCGC-AAA259A05 TaxID=1698259 RepID=A0A133U9D5_9EURY|nr:hypothetical protein AKJ57_03705 [candidate division MSBL1 archaeon SCGC-AAA259A05]
MPDGGLTEKQIINLFRFRKCSKCGSKMKPVQVNSKALGGGIGKAYGAIFECPECKLRYAETLIVEVPN